jgi:PHP family Zn ribbon phosphoesterase
MNTYKADLHIHSVLSPCGDLEMSPGRIVEKAVQKGLDIIAVTDHNHTGHAKLLRKIGENSGIWVVYGVELTTREEVHCLTFFDTDDQLEWFQEKLDETLPRIPNNKDLFGIQVIVDSNEHIVSEVNHSLYPGLNLGISEAAALVHELGGYFIPAHINRSTNGLYAQLGFLPKDLEIDAAEIARNSDREQLLREHPELAFYQLFKSSDAHYVEDIGRCTCLLHMMEQSFEELGLAFHGLEGRKMTFQ